MARAEASYGALNGAKLEYSSTQSGSYTQIHGLKTIPEIGGTPNYLDTTDLDNTEYETSIIGLMPAQNYDFEFNLELPQLTVEANIKVANDLEDSGNEYYFKLTYASGIVISFKSTVRISFAGGSTGDLEAFTMHLSPIGEPTRTLPSASL